MPHSFVRGRIWRHRPWLALLPAAILALACRPTMGTMLRRGDLAGIEKREAKRKRPLQGKRLRRFCELLVRDKQYDRAMAKLLRDFEQGGKIESLVDLAKLEDSRAYKGMAAAHFGRVLALDPRILREDKKACDSWAQRAEASTRAGDWLAAYNDARRIQKMCPNRDLSWTAKVGASARQQQKARTSTPRLLSQLPQAAQAPFWDLVSPLAPAEAQSGDKSTGAHLPSSRAFGYMQQKVNMRGEELWQWLAKGGKVEPQRAEVWQKWLHADPILGSDAALWAVFLGDAGQQVVLDLVSRNLAQAPQLRSQENAYFRVLLAMMRGDTESAIFEARIGAAQQDDLAAWWLWTARWAEQLGMRDTAVVAWSTLEALTEPGSRAQLSVRWYLLRHKLYDLRRDPYLGNKAPTVAAGESLAIQFSSFLDLFPDQYGVSPVSVEASLLESLHQEGWSEDEVQGARHRLGLGLKAAEPATTNVESDFARAYDKECLQMRVYLRGFAGQADDAQRHRWLQEWVKHPRWSPSADPQGALFCLFDPRGPIGDAQQRARRSTTR